MFLFPILSVYSHVWGHCFTFSTLRRVAGALSCEDYDVSHFREAASKSAVGVRARGITARDVRGGGITAWDVRGGGVRAGGPRTKERVNMSVGSHLQAHTEHRCGMNPPPFLCISPLT